MALVATDISCIVDSTPDFAEVSGRRAHAEAIARRFWTPRGRLIDDPNYGEDLTAYVNDDLSPSDLAKIQSKAETEAKKDERTLGAKVTVSVSAAGLMVVTCLLQDGYGPFTLVLSVTDVTVQILTVTK